MSAIVFHAALCDDLLRLASASEEFHGGIMANALNHARQVKLAVVQSFDAGQAEDYLKKRVQQETNGQDKQIHEQVAYGLGTYVARAVLSAEAKLPHEGSPVRDAFIFAWQSGMNENVGSAVGLEEGRAFLRSMLRRSLVENHTFTVDPDDIEGWMDRIYGVMQQFDNQLDAMAGHLFAPDPGLVQKHIVDTRFFDPADEAVSLARAHRGGRKLAADEVAEALRSPARSVYGEVLRDAFAEWRRIADDIQQIAG